LLVPEATFEGLPPMELQVLCQSGFSRQAWGSLWESASCQKYRRTGGWPRCSIHYARSSLDRTAEFAGCQPGSQGRGRWPTVLPVAATRLRRGRRECLNSAFRGVDELKIFKALRPVVAAQSSRFCGLAAIQTCNKQSGLQSSPGDDEASFIAPK